MERTGRREERGRTEGRDDEAEKVGDETRQRKR